MFANKKQIVGALTRLGRRLTLMNAAECSLLVCGGSALNLIGLLDRPTRDVDVLGLVDDSQISKPRNTGILSQVLPPEVVRAAQQVARDLNLPPNWLNDSALEVQRLGLPPGILRRAHPRDFGPCLKVYLLGRKDLVALKLYAALDGQKGQRHVKDLLVIRPTRSEMEFAMRWLLNRKTSLQFRRAVRAIIAGLGFPKLQATTTADLPPKATRRPQPPRVKVVEDSL